MKPNFAAMSTPELKQYVLSNRHGDEAFYQLADRLENNQDESELYPIPDTLENINIDRNSHSIANWENRTAKKILKYSSLAQFSL
jgi:hypothetical protein